MPEWTKVMPFTSIGLHNDVCAQLKAYGIKEVESKHGTHYHPKTGFLLNKDNFQVHLVYGDVTIIHQEQFDSSAIVFGLHEFAQKKSKINQDMYAEIVESVVGSHRFNKEILTKRSNDEQ